MQCKNELESWHCIGVNDPAWAWCKRNKSKTIANPFSSKPVCLGPSRIELIVLKWRWLTFNQCGNICLFSTYPKLFSPAHLASCLLIHQSAVKQFCFNKINPLGDRNLKTSVNTNHSFPATNFWQKISSEQSTIFSWHLNRVSMFCKALHSLTAAAIEEHELNIETELARWQSLLTTVSMPLWWCTRPQQTFAIW